MQASLMKLARHVEALTKGFNLKANVRLLLAPEHPDLRDPKNADAFWIRAQIFRDLGKMDAAEADLSQSLVLEPDHTRARMLRAQIRMMMDRAKEAADDASVVLEQNPADISALRAVRDRWAGRPVIVTARCPPALKT